MKKLSLFLVFIILIIPCILFDAWYLSCIYDIGIKPLFETFNIVLPAISFSIFVVIGYIRGMLFAGHKEKFDDAIAATTFVLSSILARLFSLGILYIICKIVF